MNGAPQMLRAQLARGRCKRAALQLRAHCGPRCDTPPSTRTRHWHERANANYKYAPPPSLSQSARLTAAPRELPVASCGASDGTREPVAATPARGASRTSCAQAAPRQRAHARARGGHINTRAARQITRVQRALLLRITTMVHVHAWIMIRRLCASQATRKKWNIFRCQIP